jgi:hypothetical protein
MKIIWYCLLSIIISACASNNTEILDPQSPYFGKVDFRYNFNNLVMKGLNEGPWPKARWVADTSILIEPGFNKVDFSLYGDNKIITLCFIAKPGDTVSLTYYPEGKSYRRSYPFSIFTAEDLIHGPITAYIDTPCKVN